MRSSRPARHLQIRVRDSGPPSTAATAGPGPRSVRRLRRKAAIQASAHPIAPQAPDSLRDLRTVISGARGLHDVLVEGGGQVLGALFAEDLVDDLACFVAPMLIPGGRSWVGGPALAHLADAPRLGAPDVQAVGQDLLLRYRVRPLEEW